MGRESPKTEMKAVWSEERSLLDYAVDFLKSLILPLAHLRSGMWDVLEMDARAHQEKHTHISCGLIFLFASSRGAGRFIWRDGNEGGEVLVRLQFLFPVCDSHFFLVRMLRCTLYCPSFFFKGGTRWYNKPMA